MKPHIRPRIPRAEAAATAHDGASLKARELQAWAPPRRSADAEILPEWGAMAGRSRDLDRNNPIARGARRTITDNVIGTGFRLSARPDYAALGKTKDWAVNWSAKVEARYRAFWWTTACDATRRFCGDQIVTIAAAAEVLNGGSLTLPLWMPERADGFSTKFQLIEYDRLGNPFGQPDSRNLRRGIKIDDYGAPVGYWIQKTHPGDFTINGLAGNLVDDWEFVPAYTEWGRRRVIHAFDPERSEQTRGKPLLASIISPVKQGDRYFKAELDAAVSNSKIALVLQTPLDRADVVELFSKDPDGYLKARQESAVGLESSSIIAPFPGDQVASFLPQRPAASFGAFVEMIYRIIGVALDMPYELVLKDFSKTTYTSGRMALLEAWRSFNRRRDWLGTMWLDPVYDLWLEEQVNAGAIEADGFYDPVRRYAFTRCRWIGPGRGWVDPVKEAQGAEIRMDAFISTLEDECAEQGRDYREVLEQRAYERELMKQLGLPDHSETRAANPPRSGKDDDEPADQPADRKKPKPSDSGGASAYA